MACRKRNSLDADVGAAAMKQTLRLERPLDDNAYVNLIVNLVQMGFNIVEGNGVILAQCDFSAPDEAPPSETMH